MKDKEEISSADWLCKNFVLVGDFRVDFKTSQIYRGEHAIKMEPLAMELLGYLIVNSSRYVGHRELLGNVWKGRVVSDNAIRRVVKKLRDALGDDAKLPTYIKTLPNAGYMLIAPVVVPEVASVMPSVTVPSEHDETAATLPAATALPAMAQMPAEPAVPAAAVVHRKKTLFRPLAVPAILVCGVLAGWLLLQQKTDAAFRTEALIDLPGEEFWADYQQQSGALVFSHRKTANGFYDLYLKKPETQTLTRLTWDEANHNEPRWSHDGKRIAYQRQTGEQIELVMAGLNAQMQLESPQTLFTYNTLQPSLAWSPDDSALFFIHRQSEAHPYSVFSLDIQSRELKQITFPDAQSQGDYAVRFSPDGTYLAVLRHQQNSRVQLMLLEMSSGKVKFNQTLLNPPAVISWSDAGDGVYFIASNVLYHFALATGVLSETPVTGQSLSAIVDSCGQDCLIASTFDDNQTDISELANPFLAADQKPQHLLELPLAGEEGPPFYGLQPDEIVFRKVIDGVPQIVKYSPTHNLQVLSAFTDSHRITNLSQHPGRDVVLGLLDQQVFTLDVASGALALVSKQIENAQRPHWTADGNGIYYSRQEGGVKTLMHVDVSTGKSQRLAEHVVEARQDKSGQFLYYLNENGQLYRSRDLQTAQPEFITNIPTDSNISWQLVDDYLYYTAQKGKDFVLTQLHLPTGATQQHNWQKNAYYANFSVHPSRQRFLRLKDNEPSSNLVFLRF